MISLILSKKYSENTGLSLKGSSVLKAADNSPIGDFLDFSGFLGASCIFAQ